MTRQTGAVIVKRCGTQSKPLRRRKDGRPARDVILGLAWELPPEEQRAIVAEFARGGVYLQGHVVDIAIHNYGQRVSPI